MLTSPQVQQKGKKLRSHAVCFTNPTAKLAKILPPPKKDIHEVLAVVFLGGSQNSGDDIELLEKKSPFVVRHEIVRNAIKWLQDNNPYYRDVILSEQNLSNYKDGGLGVDVSFSTSEKLFEHGLDPASTKFLEEDDFGEDFCPFSVSGVSEIDLLTMSYMEKKALALKHLKDGGEALAIQTGSEMQNQYKNPELWAGTFPWLFPYGLGLPEDIRPIRLSLDRHSKLLLEFYDKRFQVNYLHLNY